MKKKRTRGEAMTAEGKGENDADEDSRQSEVGAFQETKEIDR